MARPSNNILLWGLTLVFASGLLFSGCSRQQNPPRRQPQGVGGDSASFVNKVWKVAGSSGVAPGTLYVFLSEGTLVVASPNGKPMLGTWKYESGALTMVEESLPYKVEILKLAGGEFKIRSHNPGESVDISLVLAETAPLSK